MAGITNLTASLISEDTFAHGKCGEEKQLGARLSTENLCRSFKEN